MYKAVIWDFGGTLFDTYKSVINAFISALKHYEITEDKGMIEKHIIKSVDESVEYFKNKYGLDDEFNRVLQDKEYELNFDLVKPTKYAKQICETNITKGIDNFLISRRNDTVYSYLKYYQMERYYKEIITALNKFPEKPNSESFDYIVKKYMLNRSEVIAIGDSKCDIEAAQNAGIKSCLILGKLTNRCIEADYIITDLKQFEKILCE